VSDCIDDRYWPEPVSIIVHTVSDDGFVIAEAVGVETRRHYTTTLPTSAWEALKREPTVYTFDAPAQPFRLALEGERLRLAHTADPLLAANNAKVHLLPHQIEAVYGYMLPQPRIRHLMAHDAGAGKTIMGGLLYKELVSREPDLRTLIVAPAALTVQWQREMREKFLVAFDIVDRDQLRADGQIWTTSSRLITSLPFARQTDVIATLANVSWDLVIVDEAHHMAAYEDRETQAYRLGRVLAQNTKHLILATATPHKGDPVNFLKLLQLLDKDIHNPEIVNRKAPEKRGTPLMLRRLKEEMVDFEGQPLFKPRVVETRWHRIGNNPPEMALYIALTDYVNKTYRAAERIGGQVKVNTQFAMVILQRRMASSFAALTESLRRRRDGLREAADALTEALAWSDLEEQPEAARWTQERRAELATPARTQRERDKEIAEITDLLEKLDVIRRSGEETKVTALREILDEIGLAPDSGEKLLVFTEFKDTLDFLRALFEGWGYRVTQIDGSMEHDARRRAELDFRTTCQVMVATEAAGEGINLQFCAFMINYDLPWIPTRLEQRMGRIHRYGQTRVAHIYNLVTADTREGMVLSGLLERLDEMRQHLGDQVFDVVSALVGDASVEQWMTDVATAPTTEAAQDHALQALWRAMEEGEARYQQWQEHPFAIAPAQFRRMQRASRRSRLTPEYAQHFFVDVLEALHEVPIDVAMTSSPGDADVLRVAVQRHNVARELGLPKDKPQYLTFLQGHSAHEEDVRFLALGMDLFDRALALTCNRWGEALQQGAKFMDVGLPPGAYYLLWFLAAEVRDGLGQRVTRRLFAVRQRPEDDGVSYAAAPAAALVDLVPAPDTFRVPEALRDLAQAPRSVIEWSIGAQQLPFLARVQQQRGEITDLRRTPLLTDAQEAERAAQQAYSELAFAALDEEGQNKLDKAEAQRARAQARVAALTRQFAHESACSLGPTRVVGVATVFSLVEPPEEDLSDLRPTIAKAAEAVAWRYEEDQGREVRDVSGEHDAYPYDLHSTGPGGPRCIEVKGTTTGKVWLSENERRAAKRLGAHYYLYIVRDLQSDAPALTIIRDPLSRMTHDAVLYSGARYVYNRATWQAVRSE
jgi:superfamily II DNA or RNA helicase